MIRITPKLTYARYLLLYGAFLALFPLILLWRTHRFGWPGVVFYVVLLLVLLSRRYIGSASYENGRLEIISYRFGFRAQQVFDTGTVHVGLSDEQVTSWVGTIPMRMGRSYRILRVTEGPHTLVKLSSEIGFKAEDLAQLEQAINNVRK